METWKSVKCYEGLYEVSNTGRVRSMNYNHTGKVKILKHGCDKGYLQVVLYKEGKSKLFRIHRLVVEAFIGEIPKGLVVNHKDENKQNNNVDNLEICTIKYNNNYGTHNKRVIASCKGKKRSLDTRTKISEALKGKKLSQETRAKISDSLKIYNKRRKET